MIQALCIIIVVLFYLKFSLFNTNVIVAVQSLASEILGPVGVLVVEDQQRETAVLVERWPRSARNSSAYHIEWRLYARLVD